MTNSKAAALSRGDIVNDVAAKTDLPQSKADEVVRAYEQAIIRELANGNEVRIQGFGTFKTSFRAARPGRNPLTGAALTIAASTQVKFSAGSAFKEAIQSSGGSKGGAKGGAKGAAKGGASGGAKGGAKGGGSKGAAGGAKGGAKGAAKGGAKGSKK